MAVYTMTVTDPNGVDLKYFLPGNMSIRPQGGSITGGTNGYYYYNEFVDGVDQEDTYVVSSVGTDLAFGVGLGGIRGLLTSGALSIIIDSVQTQLATLTIALGNITSSVGGIGVDGTMLLTPDSLVGYGYVYDDANLFNVVGAAGNDTLPGSNFNDSITGGDGADVINAYGSSDTLNGGAGDDTMIGGTGDDLFIIDSGDTIIELANQGRDTVSTALTYTLLGNFENLKLAGGANRNGAGNSLDNSIIGNSGANILAGRDGADSLNGGDGADTLNGGAGEDVLNGAGGADVFVFDTSRAAGNTDTISNFGFGDKIHLDNAIFTALGSAGALSSARFRVGTSAQDANDHVIYNPATGALYYDHNGDASGGAFRIATMPTGLALTAADILVI